MTETELFKELRGKLGEETSEKLIDFIQDSHQKRFEERWDQLVTKETFQRDLFATKDELRREMIAIKDDLQKEFRSFQADIHKEFRTQLRWLLPLLFGQLGILLALLVKVFLQD